jgi:hypothetical protein
VISISLHDDEDDPFRSDSRAGPMERKVFAGQDIVLKKPARNKLRNAGWEDDELRNSGPAMCSG